MHRLDFSCDSWYVSMYAPDNPGTRMALPDFKNHEKECWHLRGRAWRWTSLRNVYPVLTAGEEYEISFWAKFDYYSGRSTICIIEFCESYDWKERSTFDITPVCAAAVARSGDWVLYKYHVTGLYNQELVVHISAFEANIAIMQAFPGDEVTEGVTIINHKEDKIPFTTFNELPFKEYASLEQRMVKYYWDLLAPYYPSKDIPEISQREYYEFVEGLYSRLYSEPEGFFTKLYEDDAHPNRFNNSDYGKPELKRHMRSDQEKIESLLILLSEIVKTGEAVGDSVLIKSNLTKKQAEQLSYMEFDVSCNILTHNKYKNIFKAVSFLASKEKLPWPLMFGWFDDTYPYLEKTFAKHYDKEQYERLTGWLQDNGYRMGSHSGLTLDYFKSTGNKEEQLGYAVHGDKAHYGFTFEFRPEPRVRQHCEPRIIQFGQMLESYDELSENSKQLIFLKTKRCDRCRYCVQTDKTGKRPLAAVNMSGGLSLCPYYPGFTFVFEKLSSKNVDYIIDFLTDMEKVIMKSKELQIK